MRLGRKQFYGEDTATRGAPPSAEPTSVFPPLSACEEPLGLPMPTNPKAHTPNGTPPLRHALTTLVFYSTCARGSMCPCPAEECRTSHLHHPPAPVVCRGWAADPRPHHRDRDHQTTATHLLDIFISCPTRDSMHMAHGANCPSQHVRRAATRPPQSGAGAAVSPPRRRGRRTRPAAVLQSRTPLTVPLVTSPASTNSACNFPLYAS
jgi:hypothetical protein